MKEKKYRVLTGLVHIYCKPYESNWYIKALLALLWRWLLYGRGWVINQKKKYQLTNQSHETKLRYERDNKT